MSKVLWHITMSLDGFIAPRDSCSPTGLATAPAASRSATMRPRSPIWASRSSADLPRRDLFA